MILRRLPAGIHSLAATRAVGTSVRIFLAVRNTQINPLPTYCPASVKGIVDDRLGISGFVPPVHAGAEPGGDALEDPGVAEVAMPPRRPQPEEARPQADQPDQRDARPMDVRRQRRVDLDGEPSRARTAGRIGRRDSRTVPCQSRTCSN